MGVVSVVRAVWHVELLGSLACIPRIFGYAKEIADAQWIVAPAHRITLCGHAARTKGKGWFAVTANHTLRARHYRLVMISVWRVPTEAFRIRHDNDR
ncbi:hypothetical protein [Pandoraea sputorum]|uniref:hypothetical protein n=1 Tax=Pandoraea sputorum TaxID=93222 RepID=UPI00123FF8AF|nr:hypothetical protein [Pandoraea sputorum]